MSVGKACYVYRSASMQLYFHVHEADCGCSAQGCNTVVWRGSADSKVVSLSNKGMSKSDLNLRRNPPV